MTIIRGTKKTNPSFLFARNSLRNKHKPLPVRVFDIAAEIRNSLGEPTGEGRGNGERVRASGGGDSVFVKHRTALSAEIAAIQVLELLGFLRISIISFDLNSDFYWDFTRKLSS